jgi:hypothetical protein
MVHDAADVRAGPGRLDSVRVEFTEQRLISDAGLLVAATLAERLGVEELVNESVWLPYRTPGAALFGPQGDGAAAWDARRRGQHR